MKKIIFIYIILLVNIITSNAQFYIEGGVGVSLYEVESKFFDYEKKKQDSRTNFSFTPLVGYQLNDKSAIGIKINHSISTEKRIVLEDQNDPKSEINFEQKERGWGLSFFDRYKFLCYEKLSFLVESSIYISRYGIEGKIGSIHDFQNYRTAIGIDVLPLISYDISNRFSIIAKCDFLRFDLSSITESRKKIDLQIKYTHLIFGANSTIFGALGSIQIGLIYKLK